jgi:hypothetical protein
MQEDKDPAEPTGDAHKSQTSKNMGFTAMMNNSNLKKSYSKGLVWVNKRNAE